MYNETCVSLPHITKLSDARKKAIKAVSYTHLNSDFPHIKGNWSVISDAGSCSGSQNRLCILSETAEKTQAKKAET